MTGGAGFLGSHLVDRLAQQGNEVIAVDNLSTGSWSNLRSDNVSLVTADASHTGLWRMLNECHGAPDFVWHLAAIADPPDYQRRPIASLMETSKAVSLACEWSERWGAKLVYTSTSEVYGDAQESPQAEGYAGWCPPQGPRSMYDEAKRFGEALCAAYRGRGNDVRVARLFNSYGHRMASGDGRVVNAFVRAALDNEPIVVHGTGDQTRSFSHWSDTLSGLLYVAHAPHNYDAVNVGSDEEVTINHLADLVREVVADVGVVGEPARDGDPQQRRPDCQRLRMLGWKPFTNLRDGIADVAYQMRLHR